MGLVTNCMGPEMYSETDNKQGTRYSDQLFFLLFFCAITFLTWYGVRGEANNWLVCMFEYYLWRPTKLSIGSQIVYYV